MLNIAKITTLAIILSVTAVLGINNTASAENYTNGEKIGRITFDNCILNSNYFKNLTASTTVSWGFNGPAGRTEYVVQSSRQTERTRDVKTPLNVRVRLSDGRTEFARGDDRVTVKAYVDGRLQDTRSANFNLGCYIIRVP